MAILFSPDYILSFGNLACESSLRYRCAYNLNEQFLNISIQAKKRILFLTGIDLLRYTTAYIRFCFVYF